MAFDVPMRHFYEDKRPLLVRGQPEQPEYRLCFWSNTQLTGDWTDVVMVTAGIKT